MPPRVTYHCRQYLVLFLAIACHLASAEGLLIADTNLSRVYESRANQFLERYLSPRDFQVTVSAFSNGKALPKATRAPYEPKAAAPKFGSLSIDELNSYVRQIKVEIVLTGRVSGSREKLEELLTRNLKLDKARGDTVVFSSLGLEIEPEAWMKEKAELKQEIATLRASKDRGLGPLAITSDDKGVSPVWMGLGGVLLVVALYLGRSFTSAASRVGTGLIAIARSMGELGNWLGRDNDRGGLGSFEANINASGAGGAAQGGGEFSFESKAEHVAKTREELEPLLQQENLSVIARYLNQLPPDSHGAEKTVVGLELLGHEVAGRVYGMLGTSAQEAITRFLQTGVFSRVKLDLMLEVVEELKSRLLLNSLTAGSVPDRIASLTLQLSDNDLVFILQDLDERMLPRILLSLDSARVARLVIHVKRMDGKLYLRLVPAVAKMAQAQMETQYDAAIIRACNGILDTVKRDPYRPFLRTYQEIIDLAGDEVGEEIIRELASKPTVGAYFKQNMITVDAYFNLPKELQAEVLGALSNREIAALAMGVDERSRSEVFARVSERRSSLVEEEYESLSSRGGNQAQVFIRKAKESVVKMIREMKENGVVTAEMLAGETIKLEGRKRKRAAA